MVHTFTGVSDGGYPSGVILDPAGNIYGTNSSGVGRHVFYCNDGYNSCGVVYKIDPSGQFTVLHTFQGVPDGASPVVGLLRDSAGNLYGTTSLGGSSSNSGYGTAFKLSPEGRYTVLYTFSGGADGGSPYSPLIAATGDLYGTARSDFSGGVVFKLEP